MYATCSFRISVVVVFRILEQRVVGCVFRLRVESQDISAAAQRHATFEARARRERRPPAKRFEISGVGGLVRPLGLMYNFAKFDKFERWKSLCS